MSSVYMCSAARRWNVEGTGYSDAPVLWGLGTRGKEGSDPRGHSEQDSTFKKIVLSLCSEGAWVLVQTCAGGGWAVGRLMCSPHITGQ